ncbi:MAG: selenoneine synthase SenA [Burkholderiales bacterium]
MHDASLTSAALTARQGGADALAGALESSRRDTLATFAIYELALPGLVVPLRDELNPPLWELGHIGWFQEFWLARNPVRGEGAFADPELPRGSPLRADADALYNSSTVAHDSRWGLPLPDAAATRADLAVQLADTLALLRAVADDSDDALYFFRLALLHEDMHHEAALYMAQALGIAIDDVRWQAPALSAPPAPIALAPGPWMLGAGSDPGFAFDNEIEGQAIELAHTVIDAQAVRWAEFLPFVESGAYAEDCCWTPAGQRWRVTQKAVAPRYLRRDGKAWQHWRHGRWQALALAEPAVHLTYHEAEAWCRWAGRRLPTEAEWERAALIRSGEFRWGDVWEWTASPFQPYPGFEPHPYRDYSAPWFDGRPVLRGASFMTQPRMRHPRYRNYFLPHRNDVPAGFRSCAP